MSIDRRYKTNDDNYDFENDDGYNLPKYDWKQNIRQFSRRNKIFPNF